MAAPEATDPPLSTKDSTADISVSNNHEGYVILLSGTHVTGKETIAFSLAQSLHCPWIKGEAAHAAANFGARAQSSRGAGYDYQDVFQRIWLAKMLRLGLEIPALSIETSGSHEMGSGDDRAGEAAQEAEPAAAARCLAVVTIYAIRQPAREAIRSALTKYSVRPIFAILQITKETLSGRTLGAEEAELAEWIMREKEKDIERPEESELMNQSGAGENHSQSATDIVMVESDDGRSVDELFGQILEVVQGIMSA